MTPNIISESLDEPISYAAAALNLRVTLDGNAEAARIMKMITAARKACEQELELSLVAKTLEIAQDSFILDAPWRAWDSSQWHRGNGHAIELPAGPVRSIVSVTYLNADGDDTVLAADQYRVSTSGRIALLCPAYGVSWPVARRDVDSVRVRYKVGYPSTDSPPQVVPEPILQAMHLMIAHWFTNREAVDSNLLGEMPLGVRYLLGKFRTNLGV